MPVVTLTVRKPKSPAFKSGVLEAVHAALVGAGVPPDDLFQRVLELDAEAFRFDPMYPDVRTRRTDDFVFVEILWVAGRSAELKRQTAAAIARGLSAIGIDPENLMVCFQDAPAENWSAAGGRSLRRMPLGALG